MPDFSDAVSTENRQLLEGGARSVSERIVDEKKPRTGVRGLELTISVF